MCVWKMDTVAAFVVVVTICAHAAGDAAPIHSNSVCIGMLLNKLSVMRV